MKLTEKDKKLLRSWGHDDKDFWQIEEATRKTIFTHNGQRVSPKTALGLLGREKFLNGVSRSAFHASAERNALDGSKVFLDSSALFREV